MNQESKQIEMSHSQKANELVVQHVNKLLKNNEINRHQAIQTMLDTGLDTLLSCFTYVENLHKLDTVVESEEIKNEIMNGFLSYKMNLLGLMPAYMRYQDQHLRNIENIIQNIKIEKPEDGADGEPVDDDSKPDVNPDGDKTEVEKPVENNEADTSSK